MVTGVNVDAGSVLFGAARRAVLGLLLERPEEQFHLRQIARLAGIGIGPVQRELAALTSAGILTREQSGRQVYFQADTASPLFADLRSLIQKTSGVALVIRKALLPLQPRIRCAVVFGSTASGKTHSASDIDLLVISDDLSFRDLAGAIRVTSAQLGREVSINLYKPSEWKQRLVDKHPLTQSILHNPFLLVIGDRDELERVAEERVVKATHAKPTGNRTAVRRHRARSESQRE